MRYSASEKYEIIQLVERSDLSVRKTLAHLDIHRSTFYNWLQRYRDEGVDGLNDMKPVTDSAWNKIPAVHRTAIVDLALDLITSPAYILMQASDKFQQPTLRVNEMWQTDFRYFKIIGWGWYYLSSVLDDYSRFIVAWRLCASMSALDVSNTLDDARVFTGIDQVKVKHRPRLLSDNGPCYIAGELSDYLAGHGMTHTRGRPYHPQTQGKIERWHRSMKNQILLENYYLPGELKAALQKFVDYYNHERYHESLKNLTPADVFYGRGQEILDQREKIKLATLMMHRNMHYYNQAGHTTR